MTTVDKFSVSAARLGALLPELERGRRTHVDWRDCDQIYRNQNPAIGDSEFHDARVRDYDERIEAIKEAAALLRHLSK